ncbi:hypothetical protein M1293_01005 [Candidatus Parvarchaeota archaeon]|nr:hypothetical protein [Candidatus Parvarchaeota archaeon]
MSLIDAFRKKEPADVPDVSDMVKNGMSDQDIIESLRQQGYDSTAIKNALIKASINKDQDTEPPSGFKMPSYDTMQMTEDVQDEPPAPKRPQQSQTAQTNISDKTLDAMQQVLEQIIQEKWESAAADMSAIKNEVKANALSTQSLEEKVNSLNERIDRIQNTMVGKTEEYNKTLSDVNIELQAFEKVIDRLVPTISDSIKELRDLIEGLKSSSQNKQP